MKDKKAYIDKILKDVFSLPNPKIKESRKEQIADFISVAVNGDTINAYLVIDVILDNKPGIYVYILTDSKLIQIGIDTKDKIRSLTFALAEIVRVERKSTEVGRMEIQIDFKTDLVGLRYSTNDPQITEFFQKVEQSWIKRDVNDKNIDKNNDKIDKLSERLSSLEGGLEDNI